MRRLWTIRGRTALLFGVASMALTAAVLTFVNVASSQTLPGAIGTTEPSAPTTGRFPLPTVVPDERVRLSLDDESVAFLSTAAAVQWQWSAVGTLGAGVLAAAIGWVVSRRMLRPIDHITDTATRLSASNLHERIALDGPDDELRRLSRTIDSLLDRLEVAFESQRRFVAQASHELRTPLAVQRAAIQIGLDDEADPEQVASTRAELLEQNRRTEHLVESLLVLAEAERGLGDRVTTVDLHELVVDVVAAMREEAASRDVVLLTADDTGEVDAPVIRGEPTLLRQAVCNLVDNAIEYNHRGGSVQIGCAGGTLVVENTGPVVPDDLVATLHEPFRRGGVDGTKRHSGLGLSIVLAIVRAHGGTLRLLPRSGGGLRVEVAAGHGAPAVQREGVPAVPRVGVPTVRRAGVSSVQRGGER